MLCVISLTRAAAGIDKHAYVKTITRTATIDKRLPIRDSVFITTPYTGSQTVSFTAQSGLAAGTYRLTANSGRLAITGLPLRTEAPTEYTVVISNTGGAKVSKKVLVLP